jgi:hypothetical protein
LDCLVQRHSPRCYPDRFGGIRLNTAPSRLEYVFEAGSFGRARWRSQPLPQPFRGTIQHQGEVKVAFADRDAGQALQNLSETCFMF